jgi:acetylornithine/N-succinyldiaminopimelate aminotransferase
MFPNTWYIEQQGRFAEFLCSRSFGKAFFCNSGAEANEAAIKLAGCMVRLRDVFESSRLSMDFTGELLVRSPPRRSLSTMKDLGPMLAGFRYAKMNDIEGVRSLIDSETCRHHD